MVKINKRRYDDGYRVKYWKDRKEERRYGRGNLRRYGVKGDGRY